VRIAAQIKRTCWSYCFIVNYCFLSSRPSHCYAVASLTSLDVNLYNDLFIFIICLFIIKSNYINNCISDDQHAKFVIIGSLSKPGQSKLGQSKPGQSKTWIVKTWTVPKQSKSVNTWTVKTWTAKAWAVKAWTVRTRNKRTKMSLIFQVLKV
jgi:hypothetical protein